MEHTTLTDTSPLVAIIDANDPQHFRCVTAYTQVQRPLLTTWACLTETTYLLYRQGGWNLVAGLWRLIEADKLTLYYPDALDLERIQTLMTGYKDIPCDFADASLIAVAERLDLERIFTLDSHFYAYRQKETGSFLVIP